MDEEVEEKVEEKVEEEEEAAPNTSIPEENS